MANKIKTHEELIREAVAEGKFEFAESDVIEQYEDIARKFLQAVFDVDYDDVMISDESCLSDFAGCCIPPDANPDLKGVDGLKELYLLGGNVLVEKIDALYGIKVDPHDYFITVFEQIRRQENSKLNAS
jgi:hypothetical protein